jgi:hypothetical protein
MAAVTSPVSPPPDGTADEGAGSAETFAEAAPPVAAPTVDEVAAAAVELARAAAQELGHDQVGDYLGAVAEDEFVVTHAFAATVPGYRGWYWAVTVARVEASTGVTVDEVVLLPGAEALLAPAWLPWAERIRPGDLGAGDLLPAAPDDHRLVPSYADDADDEVRAVAVEIGLGREQVLSPEGRADAAERWVSGDWGPDAPMAKQAPGPCGTCGFLVAVGGSLRAAFGVCANEYSAADGRVVSVEFGCGAHSQVQPIGHSLSAPAALVYDDDEIVPV